MGLQSPQLLRLHLEAVWRCPVPPLDSTDVEVEGDAVPALYVGAWSTRSIHIWRRDVSPARRARLRAALAAPPAANQLPPPWRTTTETILIQREPPRIPPVEAVRRTRQILPHERDLFETFEPGSADYYLAGTARQPIFGTVVDGQLVSVAHSSRRTTAATELGIETRPEFRRRGYALAATIRWAMAVEASGLIPFYSASSGNTPSLRLAATAGYRPFATGTSYLVPD